MLESKYSLDKTLLSHKNFTSTKYNRPVFHWHTPLHRQTILSKHLASDSRRHLNDINQRIVPQTSISKNFTPMTMRSQKSNLKDEFPQSYYPSSYKPKPSLLQLSKFENMGIPKGISSVTERRLLARAEALNQRNLTGISASQSLPKINESFPLRLQLNNGNYKRSPWTRITASEPQLLSHHIASNSNYRLAAKAPAHFSSKNQLAKGTNGLFMSRLPSRSSTAGTDYAWYNNSVVSDIWK